MLGHRKLEAGDYVAILKRRRWVIAIPAIILPVLAVAVSFFIPSKYTSQTLVLIEEPKVPDAIVKPVISSDLDSRLASMKEQILSRSHVQPIVERYNLYGTQHMNMDDRVELARKAIEIKPIRSETGHGGLPGFFVSFTASDARTAQLVCGEITSLFTNENLHQRETAAENTTDFLKTQLADAKRNLDDQDAKLAAFQSAHPGALPSDEGTNVNMLASLNTQLEASTQALNRLEQDKSYEESLLSQQAPQLTTGGGTIAVPTAETIALQNQLNQLQTQETDLLSHYTADYPDVIAVRRKIADTRKALRESAAHPGSANAPVLPANSQQAASIAQLRAQIHANEVGIQNKRNEQARIQAQIAAYQGRISGTPEVEEQFKDLTRDYDTAQKFYDDLLAKMNQSKMATDLELRQQGEQFRVMDEPNLPDAPSFPNRQLFALGGFAFGLLFGLGISAFLEYRDTALRSERDVWAFTRLPTLAILPFSVEIANDKTNSTRLARLKQLFGSETPTDTLADSGS